MSILPGLGLAGPSDAPPQVEEAREINLSRGSEWRFEVSFNTTATVKVLHPSGYADGINGTAEIFGCELAPNHVYEFCGTKASVYTHHGCTLSVTGTFESEYVAEETPMSEYLNMHFALENMRIDASRARQEGRADATGGPRVLLVGPENAGKTTLVKTLAGFASRTGRSPLVVNLDHREGMLCLPGCVSAAVIGAGAILDVEDAAGNGWGSSPMAGPSPVPVKMPLVYHYGYANPEERPEVFKPVVTRLALAATSRYEEEFGVNEAGIIVDTAGSVSMGKGGYEIIQHIVSEFSINVLLVLGSERLYSDMSRRFSSSSSNLGDAISILRLTKSGGCVDRDESYMRQARQAQVRNYFFGNAKTALSPHTQVVDADTLVVFRMGDPNAANDDHLLHGGAQDETDGKSAASNLYTRLANPTLAMQNAILAVKHASASDSAETIRDASVMGYVYVADVDVAKKKIRVLSPVGGRLPARAVVWGVWPEGVGDLVG